MTPRNHQPKYQGVYKNITEKLVDFLLVEEFNVNPEFAYWFAQQAISQLQPTQTENVQHNIRHTPDELERYFAKISPSLVVINKNPKMLCYLPASLRFQSRTNKKLVALKYN